MTPGDFNAAAALLVNPGGFVGWSVVTMGAIGYAESHLIPHEIHLNTHDPAAASYLSVDWGVWGINDFYATKLLVARGVIDPARPVSMQLLDPTVNVRAAREVFLDGGYARWNTYKNGAFKPFLSQARVAARAAGVAV